MFHIVNRKSHHTQNQELLAQPPDELVEESVVMDTTEPQDWTAFVDPSEPRYCICNEVSYGDMVACDNRDVSDGFYNPHLEVQFCYCSFRSMKFSVQSNGFIMGALD